MSSILKNCGIGPDGFEEGNDCAKGGGGPNEIKTPEFRKWFNDSKVVDDDGEPLIVYHGSKHEFDAFDMEHTKKGTPGALFFDKRESQARDYSWSADKGYGRVYPVYLRITNPAPNDVRKEVGNDPTKLKKLGYDGWIVAGQEFAVFDVDQIKQIKSKSVKKSVRILPHEAHLAATLRPNPVLVDDPATRRDRIVGATAEVAADVAAYVAGRLGYEAFESPEVASAIRQLAHDVADRAIKYLDENPDADPDAVAVYQYVRTQAMAGDLMARIVQRDLDWGEYERFDLPDELVDQLESVHKSNCGIGPGGFEEGNTCANEDGDEDWKPSQSKVNSWQDAKAGDSVDGFEVMDEIPNQDSIESSLDNYEVVGVKVVDAKYLWDPKDAGKPPSSYSASRNERVKALANKIKANKKIAPLILVNHKRDGLYVLEGSHRYDALQSLDVKQVPALIVTDLDSFEDDDSVHKSIVMQAFASAMSKPKRGRRPKVTVQVDTRVREPIVVGRALNVRRIWKTEEDDKVCPICDDLSDELEDYWSDEFPDGPPAHPNCRCRLDYEYEIRSAEPVPGRRKPRKPKVIDREPVREKILDRRSVKKPKKTAPKPKTPPGDTRRWGGRKLMEMFKSWDAAGSHLPEPDLLQSVFKNCGIGPDGFEPGNDCAKGDGDVTTNKPWKAPKPGRPSKTIYDELSLSEVREKLVQAERDVTQLRSTGWDGSTELPGLAAQTARNNWKTLVQEKSKIQSAFYYLTKKFNDEQDKSIGNKGTFDPDDPSIRKSADNCGTGAGGFQEGNTCAEGEGALAIRPGGEDDPDS